MLFREPRVDSVVIVAPICCWLRSQHGYGKRSKPDTQSRNQWLALGLASGEPVSGTFATDTGFDLVEWGNPLQRLDRDRRLRLGQIIETAAHVAPAESQRYGRIGGLGPAELLVGGVAVALEDAVPSALAPGTLFDCVRYGV
jgi:hypothetical protein